MNDKTDTRLDSVQQEQENANLAIMRMIEGLGYPADELAHLSRAFYSTGNHPMGDHLAENAATLQTIRKEVHGLAARAISDSLREAEQATVNMVRAAIAATTQDQSQ